MEGATDSELLQEIHKCLMGDKLGGQEGLIDKVDSNQKRIKALEKKKKPLILRWITLLFSIKG